MSRSGKVLYDYQKYGIQFLRQQKRVILADDVGLGKSMQCLGAVEYPLLIIAPARAHQTWIDEIFDWLPNIDIYEDVVRYRGTVKQRAIIANDIKQHKPKIVISTYGMTREIQVNITPKWKTIIFDEAHVLRNRKAHTLYVTVRGFKSDRLYFVTANPVISGAKDYWTLLNMIDRNRFASYWKFVNRYCIVEDEFFGKNVLGTNPETAGELNALLKPYMLKRTASDVEIELPDFSRQFLRIDLSQRQKQVYEDLVTEYMHFLENNEIIIAENTLTRFVRLRQLLVCPRIIGVPDDGAALNALREEVETLTEGIAIFTPFREAIPYIQNALCELDYACYTIAGGMDENRVELNRRNFLQDAESGKKVALVSTLQMGTSWSIPGIRYSYTLGMEWVPIYHEQSEGRLGGGLRRKTNVLSKYFIHDGTIDTHMRNVLGKKTTWVELAIDPAKFFRGDSDVIGFSEYV